MTTPPVLRTLALSLLLLAGPFSRAAVPSPRPAVLARDGIVASSHALASEAGAQILRQGGNAVDAAVGTGFALAVVLPSAGNLGGGGFMVIHQAGGQDTVVDYRETAPAAASRGMYLGAGGKVLSGPGSSTVGWRAAGVPGTVAGLAFALEHYGSGKVSWAQAIEPARKLAAEGFVVSGTTEHRLRKGASLLGQFEESKRIYLKGGAGWKAGETFRQPELAATLERLQRAGWREFYEGETARRIASAMEREGGTISLADLRDYRIAERAPLRGAYRGYTVVTMPPPSSGGIALLQMLGMLESRDVGALRNDPAARAHLFAEVMTRAFRDRAEYLGDPAFVRVPVARLLDPAYIKARMSAFSPDRATPSALVEPGLGPVSTTPHRESLQTTHFSVVDAAGGAVSNTYTLNGAFGCGATVPGTGILLNNEMDDFMSAPGVPNLFGLIQGESNAITPGKRPLSSMTPTLLLRSGKLFMVTGSPGGPTIINTVLQVITNTIDLGMPPAEAVAAPRIHHQWMPDTLDYEHGALPPAAIARLRAEGHVVAERTDTISDSETIEVDPATGIRLGCSDPRNGDSAAVAQTPASP